MQRRMFSDEFKREAVRPNPSDGVTTIPYEMAMPGPMQLEVFDVTGRRVRKLEDRNRAAEYYRVRWDGLDGRGRRVGAGVYFVRFVSGDVRETRKVTVLE